jgi:hypothetical protein
MKKRRQRDLGENGFSFFTQVVYLLSLHDKSQTEIANWEREKLTESEREREKG